MTDRDNRIQLDALLTDDELARRAYRIQQSVSARIKHAPRPETLFDSLLSVFGHPAMIAVATTAAITTCLGAGVDRTTDSQRTVMMEVIGIPDLATISVEATGDGGNS